MKGSDLQRDFSVDGAGEQRGILWDLLQLCHDGISPLTCCFCACAGAAVLEHAIPWEIWVAAMTRCWRGPSLKALVHAVNLIQCFQSVHTANTGFWIAWRSLKRLSLKFARRGKWQTSEFRGMPIKKMGICLHSFIMLLLTTSLQGLRMAIFCQPTPSGALEPTSTCWNGSFWITR